MRVQECAVQGYENSSNEEFLGIECAVWLVSEESRLSSSSYKLTPLFSQKQTDTVTLF